MQVADIECAEQLHVFNNEINILAVCSEHKNITKFLAAYFFAEKLWIVIEMADAGSISDALSKQKRGMSEPQVCASTMSVAYTATVAGMEATASGQRTAA